jgi:hypothetical protein
MPTCPIRGECGYYSGSMDATAQQREAMRSTYCHADYEACARYQVWDAADQAVPDGLYPDMQEEAAKMISQGETIRFTARRKDQ